MWKLTGALAVAVAGIALALPSSLLATTADARPASTSSCVECCEGDAVCVALAELADLRGAVDELVPEQGLANSLGVKVDAATRSVLGARYGAAANQIDAFGNEVEAAEQSGQVSGAVSNVLKTKHDTVKNSISNLR